MKRALFSAALLATGLASAASPLNGWYSSVFGGYTYLPDNVRTDHWGALRSNPSYGNGYNIGGRVGFQNNPMRYEAEYSYLHANADYFKVNKLEQSGVSGSSSANVIMANLYYDCPEMLPAVTPFLGIGLGYAFMQTSLNSTGPYAATYFKANGNSFAYQGALGLTYNFAENYALNLAYRYTGTSNKGHFGKIFQAQIVNAGFIYRFDQGSYK